MQLFPVTALVVVVFVSCAFSAGWRDDERMSSDDGTRTRRQKNRHSHNQADEDASRPEVTCASSRRVCQNFDRDVEKLLNVQVNEELKASYAYQSMAYYFGRDDVALRGFSKFFAKMSAEEREHAQKFMEYQNKRGGELILSDVPKPAKDEWGSGLEAMSAALELEHHVNRKLLDLHWLAQQKNDPHLQDFVEGEFLTEQVDSIKELADFITVLERVQDSPIGEHMFDQELYEGER